MLPGMASNGRDRVDPGPNPSSGLPSEGLTAASWALSWSFASGDHVEPSPLAAAAFAAFGLATIARPLRRPGLLGRLAALALLLPMAALALATADRAVAGWEERSPVFSAFAMTAAPLLDLAGFQAASQRGILLVDHPDGLVTVTPSMEKVALRWFLDSWCLWLVLRAIRDPQRLAAASAWAAAGAAVAMLARFCLLMAAYLEADQILDGERGQRALDLLSSPAATAPFLLLCGAWVDRRTRLLLADGPSREAAPALSPPPRFVTGLVAAALGTAVGLAWTLEPPGVEKPGRILIDDRLCGAWEPTARQLDTQWYGDFATYSFTSLAEWLGHYFSVDVNTSVEYSDELLRGYDVLVVKTPNRQIPETERGAIERFVLGGGGLLLVGDHTNLLGMNTHLNSLSAAHGIRFRYDSVGNGWGPGFSTYRAPIVGRHPAALHVDELGFMTSCSLELSGGAEAVLALGNCRREPHDYAGSSFFGRRGPHPEMEHGRAVLAATVGAGRGRIAAFTDSTVWSSFAFYFQDREKLAMDLVRHLNRAESPFKRPLRWLALAGAVAMALACRSWVRHRAALPALTFGLAGLWAGASASEALHRRIDAWPEARSPVVEASFLWAGGAWACPPTLGSLGTLPADRAYDTLLVAVQRLGLRPRIANDFERGLLTGETRAMVVIAPIDPPPPRAVERIERFVRDGGALVILDDTRSGSKTSAGRFLEPFGLSLSFHQEAVTPDGGQATHRHLAGEFTQFRAPATESYVISKSHGRGRVVYMTDAPDYSREGLGHCFNRPGKVARARYETIFSIFRDVLGVTPPDRRYYGIL